MRLTASRRALLFGALVLAGLHGAAAQGIEGGSYCADGPGTPAKVTVTYAGPPSEANNFMDVSVTIDGASKPAMSSYSYFGRTPPPEGFVVAILPAMQGNGEPVDILLFQDGAAGKWLTYNDKIMRACD